MELIGGLRRGLSRSFERMSVRPLGVAVFATSVLVLVSLHSSQLGRFRSRAVAQAQVIEPPALFDSFVAKVHVRVGDRVEPGMPLAELSPHFIERELAPINAEIDELLREAELARAELLVDEERWLNEELRRRPSRPSLRSQSDAVYAAQVELLQIRRAQLQEDRTLLTVKSRALGRVAALLPRGSPVAVGTSIAQVSPEFADEIVAYVPARTDAALVERGVTAQLLETQLAACRGPGTVLRRGPGVVEAPGQLRGFLRLPVHGMPVYISVPAGCELGLGQVLTVEFPKGTG